MCIPSVRPWSIPLISSSLRGLFVALALWLVASPTARAGVVSPGADWKYLDDGSDQGTAWRELLFDDGGWDEGPAQLGYGDGDEATVVSFGSDSDNKFVTTYFRHVFQITDASFVTNLSVRLLRDDGGVVYLNGVEIFRSNMPLGPVNYGTLASVAISGSDEDTFFDMDVDPNLVVTGDNILAVEVHQAGITSSDVSFDLELTASGDNIPPEVSITSPVDNAVVPSASAILISTSAADSDGTVTNVAFFQGNHKLGDVGSAPFELLWTNALPGSYTLSVVATDDLGLSSRRSSSGTRVLVTTGTNSNLILTARGSEWKYLDNGSDQGTARREPDFDDDSWNSGPAQLGYGDGDEVTLIDFGPDPDNKYITTYFRRSFVVDDLGAVTDLVLGLLRDDGAIVYLNGAEVFRDNMPGGTVTYRTLASVAIGSADESVFLRVVLDPARLVEGENLLAVEMHQATLTSSDLGFDLELFGSDDPSVLRGPWLQTGTTNSVIIRWRTNRALDSRVRYGTDPENLTMVADNPTLTTEHEVELSGLLPNTIYYYTVETSEIALVGGPGYYFKTAPLIGTAQPTRIWALGDSGTADVHAQNVRDAYYRAAGGRHTDVLLLLGDNAYNSGLDREYQVAYFDTYPATLRRTVTWPTIGNHDTAGSSNPSATIPYYQMFTLPQNAEAGGLASGTEDYYSFDYANVHFVCLDSMTSSRVTGGPMITWLTNDLAATIQDWIIAYWHHPPYSKGSHNSDTETELIEMRTGAVRALEDFGVDLVLCGHSHSYERSYLLNGHYGVSSTLSESMILNSGSGRTDETGGYVKPATAAHQGAVYVVAGSSGKLSGGALNHPAMFLSLNRLGSMVIDVEGLRLDAQFLRENGDVVDSFTLLKGPTVSIADVTVVEGDSQPTNAAFRVTLASPPAAETVTVDYATVPGSATESEDYIPQSDQLTFPVGVTERTITVPVSGDTTVEGHEEFSVSLLDSVNAQVARVRGLGTILDNESPVISATSAFAGGIATISWNAAPGLTYRVEYKAALEDASWVTLSGDVVATGPVAFKEHFVGSAAQRYYRVVWVP